MHVLIPCVVITGISHYREELLEKLPLSAVEECRLVLSVSGNKALFRRENALAFLIIRHLFHI